MKKCTSIFTILFIALVLTSCESKVSETITFKSTVSRLKILVSGERYTSLDPWTMTVQQVLSDSVLAEAKVEVFFESPTKENVLGTWKTPNDAVITFVEKDGTVKTMPVGIRF